MYLKNKPIYLLVRRDVSSQLSSKEELMKGFMTEYQILANFISRSQTNQIK